MRGLPIEKGDPRLGFSLGLALFDAVPVALFCANCLLVSRSIASPAFAAGAVICLASGLSKVVWKLVVVTRRVDHPLLARQMHVLMPFGFALLALGILASDHAAAKTLLTSLGTLPSAPLAVAWAASLGAMWTYAARLDNSQPRSNWVEECTNAAGQLCLLAALLLA